MMQYYTYGYGPRNIGGFGSYVGLFFNILFIGAIILGIVALIRYTGHDHRHFSSNSSVDILKDRYAKGEITKAEFESMKKDLSD
ncbi:MAG: SHOCT domain-containing protein [Candidatus Saccharimonadia bacterium]